MFLLRLPIAILQFAYWLLRPLKLQRKVTMISRQSNTPSDDFRLIARELNRRGISTVIIPRKLEKTLSGALLFLRDLFRQLYSMATSQVIITDGYCPGVSLVQKKQGQTVIQIWHALGAIKQFGWQTIDKPSGHSGKLCRMLRMHENYDYVLSPGARTGEFYCRAFGIPQSKLLPGGLPHVDLLLQPDEKTARKIQKAYPQIKDKINILYAPTFRKTGAIPMEELIRNFDGSRYNLILKKHFLDSADYSWTEQYGVIQDSRFRSLDWLRVCRKVITDYSAISFEAALLERELYIYEPDLGQYREDVDFNMDMSREPIGNYVYESGEALARRLDEPYDLEKVRQFRDKYLEFDRENSATEVFCEFVERRITVRR